MPAEASSPVPITIGARCTYAAFLGSGLIAVGFLAAACGEGRPIFLLHAALSAAAALLFRARLALTGQLQACTEESDHPVARHPPANRRHAELAARYEELEHERGTARFDPWESLRLRRALLRRDAAS